MPTWGFAFSPGILFFVWPFGADLVAIICKIFLSAFHEQYRFIQSQGRYWWHHMARNPQSLEGFRPLEDHRASLRRDHFPSYPSVRWVVNSMKVYHISVTKAWIMEQIGPTFGVFAGFAQAKCGQDLACVCRTSGFVFLAAVQGAIAKTCSFSDQKGRLQFAVHLPLQVAIFHSSDCMLLGAAACWCTSAELPSDALALLRHTCGDLVPSLNDSRSRQVIISFTIVLSLVWIAVALRFIARKVASTRTGLDDWLILFALVRNASYKFLQWFNGWFEFHSMNYFHILLR